MSNAPATPAMPLQKAAGPVNFMYLLMKALEKDQNSLSSQEIADAKTTEFDVALEANIYGYWNTVLEGDAAAIKHDKKNSKKMKDEQAQMNADSTTANSNETMEDGTVQAAQGQTQTDASNLQMKAQMAQGVNSILLALSNMLGRIEA